MANSATLTSPWHDSHLSTVRWTKPHTSHLPSLASPPLKALCLKGAPRQPGEPERNAIVQLLSAEQFAGNALAHTYTTILAQGKHICSSRSLYYHLREIQGVRRHRHFLGYGTYAAPQLVASATNRLWCWGTTKLKGDTHLTYQRDESWVSLAKIPRTGSSLAEKSNDRPKNCFERM